MLKLRGVRGSKSQKMPEDVMVFEHLKIVCSDQFSISCELQGKIVQFSSIWYLILLLKCICNREIWTGVDVVFGEK